MAIDYKSAGVDVEKGDAFVDWLQSDKSTTPHQDKVLDGIGGFASIFRFQYPEMKDPCLVSATDGVGTKLKLAIDLEKYDTLGQDLVAMCANDLICTGAQPLFFLDYFATAKLDLEQAKTFLSGVRKACHQSQMALIGGETAEMPGLYKPKDFDCAGFAVGAVDRENILGAKRVKKNMIAIGVSSSGFHSNGFSLLRKLYSTPEDLKKWGEKLLTPTALYVNLVMDSLKTIPMAAIAHITGGGIENIPRVLPEGLGLELNLWEMPNIFKETQTRAQISDLEMLKTFNCGVGLVLIAEQNFESSVKSKIKDHGFVAYDLGLIVESSESLIYPKDFQ
jgi:phosphoribosylformylglycinamidine cyclo-ligase